MFKGFGFGVLTQEIAEKFAFGGVVTSDNILLNKRGEGFR
jgi:hypothetical protein